MAMILTGANERFRQLASDALKSANELVFSSATRFSDGEAFHREPISLVYQAQVEFPVACSCLELWAKGKPLFYLYIDPSAPAGSRCTLNTKAILDGDTIRVDVGRIK